MSERTENLMKRIHAAADRWEAPTTREVLDLLAELADVVNDLTILEEDRIQREENTRI